MREQPGITAGTRKLQRHQKTHFDVDVQKFGWKSEPKYPHLYVKSEHFTTGGI